MRIQQGFVPPIGAKKVQQPLRNNQSISKQSFANHLNQALENENHLTISKHAKLRMAERNLTISEKSWQTIQEKVSEAKRMGVNESLVLLQNAALIVSAKNETVITAMDRKEAATQIFTNINGTIIIDQ